MRRITDKVLFVAGGILLAYEAWTLVNKHKGDTISESIWDSTKKRPFVPFAIGVLMGHFFWQKSDNSTEINIEKASVEVDSQDVQPKKL